MIIRIQTVEYLELTAHKKKYSFQTQIPHFWPITHNQRGMCSIQKLRFRKKV